MSSVTSTSTSLYLYAFVRGESAQQLPENQLHGIDNAAIRVINRGAVSAIVSSIESKKIRPQRKNLSAHQDIVTHLARNYDMLPVAFGLIADDAQQVERLLLSHEAVLCEQLDRVAGQLEMSINLRWTAPNVFQYLVERTPELLAARAAIANGTATRDDQIAMGQMFEQVLNGQREYHSQKLLNGLESVCKEIDVQPARDEADVLRAACLIPRDGEEAFTQAIHQAAANFNDEFAITFNGPWPPYSFVKLALGLE